MANAIQFDLEKVEKLAALGLSEAQIGANFGSSNRTIGRRKLDDPEFAAAFEKGRASLAQEIGGILLDHARNGSTNAAKFIADRRLGWQKETKNSLEVSAAPQFQLVLTTAGDTPTNAPTPP